MKKQQPIRSAVVAIVAGLVLASAGTLLANGGAFFIPADRGPVDLVYFARVKDARTGRPIQKTPYVNIVDPFSGIYIPFQGDSPGHFRSPDIGAAIKEVTTRADRHPATGDRRHRGGLSDGEGRQHPSPVEGHHRARREDGAESQRRQHSRQPIQRRRRVEPVAAARQQRSHGLVEADVLSVGGLLRSCGYFSGGANSRPPRVHRALSPRSRAMGVVIPRLRSNTSP